MLPPTILSANSTSRSANTLACPTRSSSLAPRLPLALVRVLLSLLAVFNDDGDCKIFANVCRKSGLLRILAASYPTLILLMLLAMTTLTTSVTSRRNMAGLAHVEKRKYAAFFVRVLRAGLLAQLLYMTIRRSFNAGPIYMTYFNKMNKIMLYIYL